MTLIDELQMANAKYADKLLPASMDRLPGGEFAERTKKFAAPHSLHEAASECCEGVANTHQHAVVGFNQMAVQFNMICEVAYSIAAEVKALREQLEAKQKKDAGAAAAVTSTTAPASAPAPNEFNAEAEADAERRDRACEAAIRAKYPQFDEEVFTQVGFAPVVEPAAASTPAPPADEGVQTEAKAEAKYREGLRPSLSQETAVDQRDAAGSRSAGLWQMAAEDDARRASALVKRSLDQIYYEFLGGHPLPADDYKPKRTSGRTAKARKAVQHSWVR